MARSHRPPRLPAEPSRREPGASGPGQCTLNSSPICPSLARCMTFCACVPRVQATCTHVPKCSQCGGAFVCLSESASMANCHVIAYQLTCYRREERRELVPAINQRTDDCCGATGLQRRHRMRMRRRWRSWAHCKAWIFWKIKYSVFALKGGDEAKNSNRMQPTAHKSHEGVAG